MNEELALADRTKDEFLATVGHELRTPLNAMLGWIHILRGGAGPSAGEDRRERALDTIERNARAQAQLIDDLLDVSRIVAGKLTLTVQPRRAGRRRRARHRGRSPGRRRQADPHPVGARLDARRSSATPTGCSRWLRTSCRTPSSSRPRAGACRCSSSGASRRSSSTVADTGQGISPEFLPHVFERFRQADGALSRKTSGLGLGLAIVRHIVELHGGTVVAHSDGTGQGATFTVRLPLSVAARRSPPADALSRGASQLRLPAGAREHADPGRRRRARRAADAA